MGDMFDLLDTASNPVEESPAPTKPLLYISPLLKARVGKHDYVVQPGQMVPVWDCAAWQTLTDVSLQIMAAVTADGKMASEPGQRHFTLEELAAAAETPSAALNINLQHALEAAACGGGAGGVYTLRPPERPVGLLCSRERNTQWGEPQWEYAPVNPLDAYKRLRDSDDRGRLWAAECPRFYVPLPDPKAAGIPIFDLVSKTVVPCQELSLPMTMLHMYYLEQAGVIDFSSDELLIAASVASLKLSRVYMGLPGPADKTPVSEAAYWEGTAGSPTRAYQFDYAKGNPLTAVFPRLAEQICAAKARRWDGRNKAVLRHRAFNSTQPSGFHELPGLR